MNKAETKVQRLFQIEALLLAHPEGLSQSEIAKRLNVNRSTVHRYLPDLTQNAPVFEEDGRLFIDRKAYLVNLKLNLYEALSLHLAARLLTNRMERHNLHTASLLRKLSLAIDKLTPQFSRHLSLSADVADDTSRFQDPHYISILETVALAWAEGRKVKIWHRHTETNQVYDYIFSVYFIEPYAVGYSIHAVGLREPPGEIRTFNLARIERVELTGEFYLIPEDFDPTELLKQAWGIWYTENDPQEVQLRFSPTVANRVLETRWHSSQQTRLEEDGSLWWKADVAEIKEMIPWIRGWGADCEVLAPASLRSEVIKEITAMQGLYIHTQRAACLELWAKFTRGNEGDWHPLLWHLLDTAAVAELLWKDCLSFSFKSSLAAEFQLSLEGTGKLLTFWAALHDIGKAGPEFQKKNSRRRLVLEGRGFNFPQSHYKVPGFHGMATTLILQRIFTMDPNEKANLPAEFGWNLADTLGGHHGEFPNNQILNQPGLKKYHVGDAAWQNLQDEIYAQLHQFLEVPVPGVYPDGHSVSNSLFVLLAGLTTTADWIASNEAFFPFLKADMPLQEYYAMAQKQAKTALTTLGWYGWKSTGEPVSFETLFPTFSPNPIQQTVIRAGVELESPFLMILEAPTGSGKTEAALYLADTILQREQKSGLYVAMPTQATSNQMHHRTAKFLAYRYSEDNLNLQLVHGAALLADQQGFAPTNVWGEERADFSNIQAQSWFLPRKKTLLAPFGVGTVDQTFLSVLKSKHFFLRLFGLSHKVLIFDEVHAYDVYMTQIFKTLLHWLRAVGTSVIILTATLPPTTRRELLQAYGAESLPADEVPFPRLSLCSKGSVQVIQAGDVPSRTIQLEWMDPEAVGIAAALAEKLAGGGCAAVICNRVRRAQEVYDAVRAEFQDGETEVILFHARFPHCWRQAIEQKVLAQFGKDAPNRPRRAIVIATQVIEQSLDLDFDLMVTDLAPVDLLIQRIGRLHRHQDQANPPHRPAGLARATCILCAPAFDPAAQPEFGPDQWIYDPYLLYRTQAVLGARSALSLPGETDQLIQAVYSLERSPSFQDSVWETLQSLKNKMLKKQEESAQNARNYLIPLSDKRILGNLNSSLSDDVEGLSRKVIKAPTREISPSVQIVCLVREAGRLHPLADPNLIDLEAPLTRHQVRACLRSAVTLNDWRALKYFFNQADKPPECFTKSAPLRGRFPVIFENGQFETEGFILRLDQERGLDLEVK